MSDLISRQDAIDALRRSYDLFEGSTVRTDIARRDELSAMIARLKSLPSAEPKTGKWIKATGMMPPEFHGHHCCSECGNFANMEPPFGNREGLSKFCPNCGSFNGGEKE